MSEKLEELISLLYQDRLTQYGKRLLVENIVKLQKENEELRKKLNEENKRCMMLAIEKQDYFEKYRYNLQQNESLTKEFSNVIPVQKVKDIIDRINYDIKKTKEIHGFFNDYYIIVNGASRKISMFENLSPDKSFSNKIEINKKKLIHDLIKEKLVEGENKWFLH